MAIIIAELHINTIGKTQNEKRKPLKQNFLSS